MLRALGQKLPDSQLEVIMMDRINRASITARLAIVGFVSDLSEKAKSDKGQGSVEYVGIIIVVVAIIAVVVAASSDIGDVIKEKLQEAISQIGE